jgi:hypothetical protein
MSRNEIIALSVSASVFAVVIASFLAGSSINIAQAIEITITFVLVLITTIYVKRTSDIAKATKEQADASVRMAKEMRNARAPAITIKWGGADTNRGKISAHLENEGFGPALNPECYLTHKEFAFNYKLSSWCTTFKVGEKYPFSLPSEDFDFKAWKGLAINCDYRSIDGEKFRSILRCESEKDRRLERIKLNSGDGHD